MTVNFNANTTVSGTWTNFKAITITVKSLPIQYDDDGTVYTIFAFDGQTIVYICNIWKGTVPDGVINGGYSQAQNDSDKSDFETNYKANANKRIYRTDNFGDPINVEFAFALSMGLVSGASVGRAQGYTATSATSGKAIRATTYTPQGANAQRSVNSTSASDAAAGTGARTVTINYLNTSFQLKSETVTLNGVTGVNTVNTDIAFIESIQVSSVGSGGGNVGTIQVWTGLGATGSVWGSIAASDNQTFWAHHYVPTGVTCYILGFSAGATVVAGQCNLNRIGNPLVTTNPQLQIGVTIMHVGAGTWDHNFDVPLPVTGPDLIWLVERPVAVTASTAVAGFEYVQF